MAAGDGLVVVGRPMRSKVNRKHSRSSKPRYSRVVGVPVQRVPVSGQRRDQRVAMLRLVVDDDAVEVEQDGRRSWRRYNGGEVRKSEKGATRSTPCLIRYALDRAAPPGAPRAIGKARRPAARAPICIRQPGFPVDDHIAAAARPSAMLAILLVEHRPRHRGMEHGVDARAAAALVGSGQQPSRSPGIARSTASGASWTRWACCRWQGAS